MSVASLRARLLILVLAVAVALGWSATAGQTQGQLKGKVLPVVSTSDVIGYVAPCG